MSTIIIETIKDENRRAQASYTQSILFDLYEVALTSEEWENMSRIKQANIFNEIRELVELKQKLEALKPELAKELATEAN